MVGGGGADPGPAVFGNPGGGGASRSATGLTKPLM